MRLAAEEAATEAVTEALATIQRQMAFADAASWRVMTATDSTATVVALATDGGGANSSTERQEFTLHVDLEAARPIYKIDVLERSRFDAQGLH